MVDKLDLVLNSIKDLKTSHGKRLDKIDENLKDHMRRTELLENRVDVLEEPRKALKFIKTSSVWISSILGVIWIATLIAGKYFEL